MVIIAVWKLNPMTKHCCLQYVNIHLLAGKYHTKKKQPIKGVTGTVAGGKNIIELNQDSR